MFSKVVYIPKCKNVKLIAVRVYLHMIELCMSDIRI